MTFGKLGTAPNDQGGFTYANNTNPLLNSKIFGINYWGWVMPMNPVTFATKEAALAIASVVGGKIVPDPQAVNWKLGVPAEFGYTPYPNSEVYAVELPGKLPVNCGYFCEVMGNDVAFNNAYDKSEAICNELLGIPVDPSLADKLFHAFSTFLPL